jgi:5-methyltetrahydrofolate--homocysteine methyltransferase
MAENGMSKDLSPCYGEIIELLPRRQNHGVLALVEEALNNGAVPRDIVEQAFIAGLKRIGGEFPRILFAADIIEKAGRELLRAGGLAQNEIRAVICTVRGDLHSVGKDLVKMMMELTGIRTLDLGVDCDTAAIIDALAGTGAGVLCLSSLLPTTMPVMADVVAALKTAGIRRQVKVVAGGALVTRKFAERIGADGYAPDAVSGAELCARLLNRTEAG